MKFRFLIVDDEPLARRLIASHAMKMEGLEMAGECGDAIEAINFLRTQTVDLIFLDIQMPEVTGIQVVRSLKNPPSIIFTTAHRDFAPEAFDLEAVDYLLKPISFERFARAVSKFFERRSSGTATPEKLTEPDDFIHLKVARKVHKIQLKEIVYIESMDEYVKVHLKDKTLITRENISTLERKLNKGFFVRIHRSFIISTKWTSAVSAEGVEVGNKLLPFGRAFRQSALAVMGINLK